MMTGALDKHVLRKSLRENIPERYHDVAFGANEYNTTCFNQLWRAITMHFGEMELIARREYERGYHDGKKGRKQKPYK
jgi:hypothetical protein